jgi:hypothetical protein
MKMIKVFIIHNEFEGDEPLYFRMDEPVTLTNYMINNIDLNEKREFELKEITQEEFDALDNGD